MIPTADQLAGLDVVLNEARFTGFEFDPIRCVAQADFVVRVLGNGPEATPDEVPASIRLFPVGRIAAAFAGSKKAHPKIGIQELSEVVASFSGRPVYGWEFLDIDLSTRDWLKWPNLDYRTGRGVSTHTLCLFQEEPSRSLDICIWFDEMEVQARLGIDALIAGGKNWWDAVTADDPRTHGSGIVRLSSK